MRRAVLAALALALAAGCDTPASEGGVERDEFVAAYVALRRATIAGELYPARRDSILEAHGTSEAELRAYIERHADDPAALADTWRAINDSIAARDSAATASDTAAVDPGIRVTEPDSSSDS